MDTAADTIHHRTAILSRWVGRVGLVLFIIALGAIVYFDDLQLTEKGGTDVPTIYNVRVVGIKIIDAMAVGLMISLLFYLTLRQRLVLTYFHKCIGIIVLVYCYAAVVGFIYSFFFHYDHLVWLQDLQQTIYMAGFFLLTFHFLDTMSKWKLTVICFLVFMALKNVLITYWTLTGIGKLIGDWAFRASENAEFAYFPMMFFPLLMLLMKGKSRPLKSMIVLISFVYLFNSLIGIYRTVWVMLILGSMYMLTQIDRPTRTKFLLWAGGGLVVALAVIAMLYPRYLELAWSYKFASIFEWSVEGDRSNATRVIEIINVTDRVISHFAFLHGMGLGAWWDDSTRRLLPDWGSGLMNKTKFTTTHMLMLTQFLKLGLVAMAFYWISLYRMFRRVARHVHALPWSRWEKGILLGLNIGLLCAFISSADYVRLFTMIGVNIGMTASFLYLDQEIRRPQETNT